jgi:protocatechuate 3,4-dioxygenase beta subunit
MANELDHHAEVADDDAAHDEIEDHDRGLSFDLRTIVARRKALKMFAGAGLLALAACSGDDMSGTSASTTTSGSSSSGSSSSSSSTSAAASSSTAASTTAIPEETAGPYPGDGSNGPNVLKQSGVVRNDIRSSFGSASGTAAGVPLTIKLRVVDVSKSGAAVSGAAVYVWHCDREGRYSMYSQGVTNENYLRGVQQTDSDGNVTFTSVFPGCYSGRWPHIHFEVYPSLDAATSAGSKLVTSQLALPEDACDTVYGTDGYSQSVRNLSQTSLSSDMVFRDGYSLQLATVTGNVDSGMTAQLNVPV